MRRAYHGTCHCGRVRFEVQVDLAPEGQRSPPARQGPLWEATFRCNCTFCRKTRFWRAFVPPEHFTLLSGHETLVDYTFGPVRNHYAYCRECGVHLFHHADFERMGGLFYSVNLACLDDAAPDELAAAPVRYVDGLEDRFDRAPAVTSYL